MASLDAILRVSAKGDASGLAPLTRGLQQVQKTGQEVNRGLGGIGNILGSLTGGIVALGAGITAAGVMAFAKSAIDAADNMRDLSQKTGASVENLSKFQQVAEQSGTSIEAVGGAMVKLSRGMAEAAATGKGPASEALRTLGISAVDASGKLLGADEVMLQVADRFQRMPDGAQKAALAVQLFGKSGAEMIPMLNEGRQAIESLDASMTTAFAEKADAYNDSLATMGRVFGQIGMAVAEELLPYLSSAVDWLTKVGIGMRDWIVANKEPIRQTIETIAGITKAIGPWVIGIGLVVGAYATLTAATKALAVASAVATAVGPGGLLKLGLAAAGAGLAVMGVNKMLEGASSEASNAALEAQKLAAGLNGAGQAAATVAPQVDNAKQQQEAFKAAVDQSNASYQLLGATIDSTAQAIDRQGKLKIATLDADIAVNNAAKSILEIKLSQAKTEGERIAILQRIQGIEIENARIQQRAQGLQLDAEIRMAGYRAQKERNQLAQIQREYDIARAMGEQTDAIARQLRLQAIKLKDAEGELRLTRLIADEKRRGIQAETDAKIAQARARADAAGSSGGSSGGGSRGSGSALPGIRTPYPMVGQASVQAQRWAQGTSFAGGGYTGNAPRSGGLDGKGGFMAMLHPRETVIDHTAGGGAAPSVTIKTGPVMQMADGSQWVSMADLEQAMQATAAGVFRQLRSPSSRLAMGGA